MARVSVLCGDLGHGPLYTAWMFTGALRRRHEVTLAGPRPERIWPPADGEVEPDAYLSGTLPTARVRHEVREATKGADLVYAFKALPASVGLGRWLRRDLDIPLAVHLDDWDGGYFSEIPPLRRAWYSVRTLNRVDNELYYRVFERLARGADLLTVSTRALQKRFGGTVVRQGVDDRRFRPGLVSRDEARERLGLRVDDQIVVFIGTPTLHKGVAELIEAVRGLDAKLVIAGTPPDAETRAVLSRDPQVEVRPYFPFRDVPDYVAAADVLCAPQRPTAYAAHQLPAKILHWMALGGCIVTTDVGDARELLGGSPPAGVIVPPLAPDALRDALVALLADAAGRAALASEAAERARRLYSWTAMSQELERLFGEVGVR